MTGERAAEPLAGACARASDIGAGSGSSWSLPGSAGVARGRAFRAELNVWTLAWDCDRGFAVGASSVWFERVCGWGGAAGGRDDLETLTLRNGFGGHSHGFDYGPGGF